LWQNGQFFVHVSKRELKALYYEALSHFLAVDLSIIPFNRKACKNIHQQSFYLLYFDRSCQKQELSEKGILLFVCDITLNLFQ
ncbi:hypothetical protein, partial [Glaesserella parasuis]|uniref:hypothetical protein n=1 Tax=Glaesserella parasuis TaxID=738 RepID=UPI0024367F99